IDVMSKSTKEFRPPVAQKVARLTPEEELDALITTLREDPSSGWRLSFLDSLGQLSPSYLQPESMSATVASMASSRSTKEYRPLVADKTSRPGREEPQLDQPGEGLPDMTEFQRRLNVSTYPGNSVVDMRNEERM